MKWSLLALGVGGYTVAESVFAAIGSEQQAAQIFEWLDGKRIIADDKQKNKR